MVYAFLTIYCCFECHSQAQNLGVTGHGSAWQDAAYAVCEATYDSTLLNLDVDLGREHAVVHEWLLSKKTLTKDVKEWGLDAQAMREVLGYEPDTVGIS